MKKLLRTLTQAGQSAWIHRCDDGSRLLILRHGGRVLGLYSSASEENFYWTHPALESAKTARAFYAGDQWHNSGGDRTWLAPEVDLFLPDFPRTDRYVQQRSIDPGNYRAVKDARIGRLVNRLRVHLSRSNQEVTLRIAKSFETAAHPLRHERDVDLRHVEYAGYTQITSLELLGSSRTTKAAIGLWNLVQMPHGGEMVIPTYARTKPLQVFGKIPAGDCSVEQRAIRYRMRARDGQKISVRAIAACGRVSYSHPVGDRWALIIRNFFVNPSGKYVDVPWRDADYRGFAVQACNVNTDLGAFSELEYHVNAIGGNTHRVRCEDTSQVWAFRGPRQTVARICKQLVG